MYDAHRHVPMQMQEWDALEVHISKNVDGNARRWESEIDE